MLGKIYVYIRNVGSEDSWLVLGVILHGMRSRFERLLRLRVLRRD